MKKQLEYDGKILQNNSHSDGSVLVGIEKEVKSWLGRFLGRKKAFSFPVKVDEAGEWHEGDEIKISVENLDRGP